MLRRAISRDNIPRVKDGDSRRGRAGGWYLPTPTFLQLGIYSVDSPSGLVGDSAEDFEDFLLLPALGQCFSSSCEGPQGHACCPSVLQVCRNPANLVGMMMFHPLHFILLIGAIWIDLRQDDECGMIKQSSHNRTPLDDPNFGKG